MHMHIYPKTLAKAETTQSIASSHYVSQMIHFAQLPESERNFLLNPTEDARGRGNGTLFVNRYWHEGAFCFRKYFKNKAENEFSFSSLSVFSNYCLMDTKTVFSVEIVLVVFFTL